ncbi:MAG: MFS transporter, partial [Candidatus Chisholmbacteria bacterium]|nr:MFS transporter [Candidatus Chisholmbacteria bacterium]
TQNFQALVIYNFYFFLSLLIIYILSGYWLKNYSARTLIKLGNLVWIVFLVLLIFLKQRSIEFLVPLGIINGISGGLFWSGFNLHQYLTTHQQDRDYFFGIQEFWSNLARITGPILGGLIITFGNYINPTQSLFGYYLLFGITTIIVAIATKYTWGFPRFSGVDFKLLQLKQILHHNPPLKSILFQQALLGLRDVSLGTLVSIITFLILKQELNVGIYNSVIGLFTAIGAFAAGKLLNSYTRIKLSFLGALSLSLSTLILTLSPNLIGLTSFSLLGIPGLFFWITLGTLFYTVADLDHKPWRLKYAYLVNRDIVLGVARILSYVILWWLFTSFSQAVVIQWWLIFISFLPLLIWVSVRRVSVYVHNQ